MKNNVGRGSGLLVQAMPTPYLHFRSVGVLTPAASAMPP